MAFEKPEIKEVFAKDLNLSKTNPRFPHPVESEEEAILSFFRLKKVGQRKLKTMIQDIVENKIVLEDFIVLKTENEYVVYDGNRRLAVLKLFIADNVEIIKNEFPSMYSFIKRKKREYDISKLPLTVKIYTDSNSMMNHVLKIHSGEQKGVGQIRWDSNEKDSFISQFTNKPLKIGNLIYKKIEQDQSKGDLYKKIKNKSYATTFERIFNYSGIKRRIFHLKHGEKIDLNNEKHFEKVCEMIEYFISQDAKVKDVYLKDDAINFFKKILPINNSSKSSNSVGIKVKIEKQKTSDIDNKNLSIKEDNIKQLPKHVKSSYINPQAILPQRENVRGRPRKEPKEYEYLLKAYPFKNHYRKNSRINALVSELEQIPYKEFRISTNFLIRSLLETYAYEYTKLFNSIELYKLKGLTLKNFRTKEFHEKYFDYISHHIGGIDNGKYNSIKDQILMYFNKNNNVSITQKLNHYVHSPDFQPSFIENLETWEVVSKILEAIDELLIKYSGQNY